MQTDPTTGAPRFLNLPTPEDLQAGAVIPSVFEQRKLRLKPRTQKPKAMGALQKLPAAATPSAQDAGGTISGVQQASGGVLVDQNGRALYYSTHMERAYFSLTQQYFGPAKYQDASPTTTYPAPSTVFKAAWRIVPQGQSVTDSYTVGATIDLLESDGNGGLKPNGQTADVTVALVGVHVVGVVQDHPEFLWATFEQVNNSPDLPAGMAPNSPDPVSNQNYTFYKAGTPANACNQAGAGSQGTYTIDPATQVISPITNVFRQFAYGGATPALRVADIMSSNQNFQSHISGGSAKTINPVFGNYRLIGTVWELPTLVPPMQPGDGNMDSQAVGSIYLMSSVLETFVQQINGPGNPGSCFTCHNTSAVGSYPAKDINLSHVIINSLPSSAGIRSAR
jgi:hypothetical protein